VPQLIIRSGKYSAECYFVDPTSGKRRRVLRATGIRADGSRESERTAAHVAQEIEAGLTGARGSERARQSREPGKSTFRSALAKHIATKRLAGASAGAIDIVVLKSEHPLRYFGVDRDLHSIDEAELTAYATRALESRASGTVTRELMVLSACMREIGVARPKFPKLGKVKARELWLDSEQMRRLLREIPEELRDHVLMYRLLGLSLSELYRIQPSDVDFARKVVRVRGTKRETRDRVMPMSAQVSEILARTKLPFWQPDRSTLWGVLTRAGRRAGVISATQSLSTNVLRASFCTELVLHDVHTRKIAQLMGHASTKTADQWYARLRADRDLHAAVDVIETL
jgi:integrase